MGVGGRRSPYRAREKASQTTARNVCPSTLPVNLPEIAVLRILSVCSQANSSLWRFSQCFPQ